MGRRIALMVLGAMAVMGQLKRGTPEALGMSARPRSGVRAAAAARDRVTMPLTAQLRSTGRR